MRENIIQSGVLYLIFITSYKKIFQFVSYTNGILIETE